MKKHLFMLLVVSLISCSKPQRASESFPNFYEIEEELVTYEGILPSREGLPVLVELTMQPASPGMDSYYHLKEELADPDDQKAFVMRMESRGKYAVLAGADGGNFVQLFNKRTMKAIQRGGQQLFPPDLTTENVYLKSNGDNELILADEDFREVIPRYVLTRRSALFTVEGYFTVYPDSTTDFYERNTGKKWLVAQLGHYDEVVSRYHWLAKEKFEGVYLKALAYTVRQPDPEGDEMNMIVVKKILEIDSTKAIL